MFIDAGLSTASNLNYYNAQITEYGGKPSKQAIQKRI